MTDAEAELHSSREGSQDYDMEEDDSDVLLKTLEELEQIVPVVESNDWKAETCQAEECRGVREVSKETKTHNKGPYSKLLSLLHNGAGVRKERLVVEEMSVDVGLIERVPSKAAPELAPRSRRLRSGREF